MDSFIASLKPQTINLDAFDDISSTSSIPLYFWYERTVPFDVLEASFYRALEEFPILTGHIKTGNDSRNFVVIDKNHLNLPVYTDSLCNVHFQTLKDADFDIKLLPVDYSSACKTPAPHGIIGRCMKLAEFHVLRMKDDSGMCIFASIAHTIFDGTGYDSFIKRWAEISKCIFAAQDQQDIRDIEIPVQSFQHDRSILETSKHNGSDAIEPEIRDILNTSTAIARWVAWFSPELRGRIFKYLLSSPNIQNYYVRLSNLACEYLVQLVQPLAEPGVSHLSANDVITALATVLFSQALHKAGRLNGETVFLTNIMIDMRPRVKRLTNANYMGNAVLINGTTNSLDLIMKGCSPQVLATVACSIRRIVDGIDERYCNQMGSLLNKNPSGCVDLAIQLTKASNEFMCTNHTRFGCYETDFGSGTPALVRPAFLTAENDFAIMPAHPDIGGYELAFTTVPEVAVFMMKSEYWKYIY
ncbi:hypothetical protein EV178_005037 [Coemansia sp. RSA 1646]|nr:hypothetical protein EV178_005037 [Coemansia sp. RSA 1646]KAJ1772380.1 hypothetical protein LPJ74_001470 [Coemansia sp. RSA 1843]KAJ2091104.1 hypothetical protein IW138_002066 [Coemansia sp. RSA 986]